MAWVEEYINGQWVPVDIPDAPSSYTPSYSEPTPTYSAPKPTYSAPKQSSEPKVGIPIPDTSGLADVGDGGWLGIVIGVVLALMAIGIFWSGASCWWGGMGQISMLDAIGYIVMDLWGLTGFGATVAMFLLAMATAWSSTMVGMCFMGAIQTTDDDDEEMYVVTGIIMLLIAFISNGLIMNAGMVYYTGEAFVEGLFDFLLLIFLYLPGTVTIPSIFGAIIGALVR